MGEPEKAAISSPQQRSLVLCGFCGKLPDMVVPSLGEVSPRLDWDRIEAWSQQLVEGDLSQINAVFEASGSVGPRIRWQPQSWQIATPQLQFLQEYWCRLEARPTLPRGDQVDLRQLAPIRDYEMLVDVVEGGRDFRCRCCSATIAAYLGYDATGKLISEQPLSPHVAENAVALFRAAFRRGDPLYIERMVEGALYAWHVLMLPLADDADKIVAFLVGAVPVGAAGLPITMDP